MASFTISEIQLPAYVGEVKIKKLVLAVEIAIKLLECQAKPFAVAVALENALTEFRKPEKVAQFPVEIQQRRIS